MNNLAIIPARGGSKRIPRKNIRDFLGKPIIAYSIETALQSRMFEEVMVSTDDEEIAEIAKTYGAKVPFMRSASAADDFATTADVLLEVIDNYAQAGRRFTNGCCIYPTSPLLTTQTLQAAYEKMVTEKLNSVFPVIQFSYPIYRALAFSENRISMIWPENLNMRSQDLPPAYHDAGQFYWFNIESFLSDQKLFTDNSNAIVIDEKDAQDIDNETDWHLAELKFRLRTAF